MYLTRTYVPQTKEDEELFKATNDYMLSVFDKKLMTSQATQVIHELAEAIPSPEDLETSS